ncbi:MAG: undecaprenyldiphospho-muramoylpentapeptide beta-N-acetylglucosaminyltransferase [Acidobacteriota bacterium]
MLERRRVLISGGGTGGHVFPGLAVAAVLESRGWSVAWAGGEGLETRLVGEKGYPFHRLAAKPVVGRGVLGKLLAILVLLRSMVSAASLVRKLAARVVIGTGGYVSAPAVLGARLTGRPVLLLEPNAEVGLANRMLARFATEATVAYPAAQAHLKCRSVVTGTPVRAVFATIPEALPEGPFHLLVLGGSQGAKQLNVGVPAALAALDLDALDLDGEDIIVTHQAGARWAEAVEASYRQWDDAGALDHVSWRVTPFLDDVAGAMAASHLVVSRAGALTLAELCVAGRPSVLVPLAAAAGHQRGNAAQLASAGAAVMIDQPEIATELARTLTDLHADRSRLDAMAVAARQLANPDAATAIADRAEALDEEKRA